MGFIVRFLLLLYGYSCIWVDLQYFVRGLPCRGFFGLVCHCVVLLRCEFWGFGLHCCFCCLFTLLWV